MAKDMPIHKEEIKPWKFYWHPPKSFYHKGDLDFWKLEYAFVIDIGFEVAPGVDEYMVVSSNAHEDIDESQVEPLTDAMETNFFFEVEEGKIHQKAYYQVMLAIFESELLD